MEASGTLINNEKSNVYFFNINNDTQRFLARTLGFKIGTFPMKYLGFPMNHSFLKVAGWVYLLNSLHKCLQNWAFRALNVDLQYSGNIQATMHRLQDRMKQIQQEMILHGRTEALATQEGNILSELEERRK